MRSGPLIGISVPLGYYARNLLRSGVLEHLVALNPAVRVAILSQASDDAEFVQEFGHNGYTRFAPLHAVSTALSWPERLLWKGRYMVRRSRTLSLSANSLLQHAYLRWGRRYYTEFFDREQPALIVTGSPGFHSNREIPLIREAQARGIPTLCVVFSWDNLTTHVIMPTRPDHLAVWNPFMRDEAIHLHFYAPEAVTIVGPPHFDPYQDPQTFTTREAYCHTVGLDPAKRIILVAAGDNELVDNTFILDILREAQEQGALPRTTTQLLVRPHPMDPTRAFDRYRSDPHFVFDRPSRHSPVLGWNPTREDMRHLANTLKHSDVVINVASTIALEAAILDRPIINVCFSPTQPERFSKWVLQFHYGGHYRPIKEHQGCWLVWNAQALIAAIHTYLEHPEWHRAQRRAMAEALCYRLDGQASRRIAELMLRLIGPVAQPAATVCVSV